jgi:hypothetical protein
VTFFGWMRPIAHVAPHSEPIQGDVMVAARFAEFKRLASEPLSNNPKDRAEYEAMRAAWLASREQGC